MHITDEKKSFFKPVYYILQMKEDDTFNWKRIEVQEQYQVYLPLHK